jgi:hypothetical protein
VRLQGRILAAVGAVLLALGAWVGGARAQEGAPGGGGEVSLNVARIGVGGRARPGHWTAFEIEVTDSSPEIRTVIVRLDVPDLDGDTGEHVRAITTKPGAKLRVWLYARIPFDSSNLYVVRALEALERKGMDGETINVAGRELGLKPFNLRGLISIHSGLIGVVGRREAGLDQYAQRLGNEDHPVTGHELIEIASGLLPVELPDRWMGLMPLEALVWTGTSAEEQPGKLSESQASAIREWVLRGGHLIVVMPPVGQTWVGSESNPLADIMPAVDVQREEEADLQSYLWLLTSEEKAALPPRSVVHSFTCLAGAEGGGAFDAMPILAGPDGRTVVVRRLVGTGAVTLVGIDVVPLAQLPKALRADVFWHRILGRRHEIKSPAEIQKEMNDPRSNVRYSSREDMPYDEIIAPAIEKQSRAAAGLLLALVVFGTFWLLAGPVGFFLLKKQSWVQHSWVAFVVVIGLFTAIAWTGATSLRQTSADGLHYTLLDHVYGQPVQRARSWMNLYLPRYGDVRVSVGERTAADARLHQALAAWDPPRASGGAGSFPDARGYEVDARNPDTIVFPARSTVKPVQIDWAGSPRWKMPLPILPEGEPPALGKEIWLSEPPATGPRGFALTGMLKHDLPGPLEDVLVVVVKRQAVIQKRQASMLPAEAQAYSLPAPWKPGEVLDLASVTAPPARSATGAAAPGGPEVFSAERFLEMLTPTSGGAYQQVRGGQNLPSADRVARAVALLNLLEPYDPRTGGSSAVVVARRDASHGYDLSRWITQPCVIIVGTIDKAVCPVPVAVDGREVPTRGKTVLRWVYPLPADPPRFAAMPVEEEEKKEAEGGG